MPITPEQAQQLLAMGAISQDTYNMVPQPVATPSPVPMAPAPIQTPILDEEARVAALKAEGYNPKGGVLPESSFNYLTPAQVKERGLTDLDMKKNFNNSLPPSPLMPETNQAPQSVEQGGLPLQSQAEAAPASIVPPVEMPSPDQSVPAAEPRSPAVQKLAAEAAKEIQTGFKEAQYQGSLAKGMEEQAAKTQERMANIEAAKAKAEADFKIQQASLDEQIAQYRPKDYWEDKGTGNKIAAAIAVALGGYGAGMNGGPNQALGIINGAIEQDAQRQKQNFEKLKGQKDDLKSTYGLAMNAYKDDLSATLATQKAGFDALDLKLKVMDQKTGDQVKKAQIQNLMAETDLKRAEAAAKLAERQKQLNIQKALKGGSRLNPEDLSKEDRGRYVDDSEFSGLARTEGEGVKFRESVPTYRQTMDSLKRLKEIALMPAKSLSPTLRAEVEQNRQLLVGTLREDVLGPGTIQQNERDALLNGVLGNPTGILNLDASNLKKLDNLMTKIQTKKFDQARSIGLNVEAKAGNGLSDSVNVRVAYKDPKSGKEVNQVLSVPRGNLSKARERIGALKGTFEEI